MIYVAELTRVSCCRQPVFIKMFCENLTMEGLKKTIYPGVPCTQKLKYVSPINNDDDGTVLLNEGMSYI